MGETNYVRCATHCKHPAYTKEEVYSKEEIDNKFSTTQSQTIIIVKSESGAYPHKFLYPDGFNKGNTNIIGCFSAHLDNNGILTVTSHEFQDDYFYISETSDGSHAGEDVYAMIVRKSL